MDNIVAVGALAGLFSRGAQSGDIKRVIDGFQLGRANGELLDQVLTYRIGDGDDVASLVNAPDFLLFQPAVKTAAVSEIGRGEHAVQAKPDVAPVQQAAAGDNAVGFMQIREHQIETALLFCFLDCRIKLARAPGQLRQLTPRLAAAIGDDLIIQPFRQRIIADVAQGKK